MGDDVVEHLAAVDPLADEVVVVGVDVHGDHAADVRVVQEQLDGGFTDGAHFFGQVFLLRLVDFGRGRLELVRSRFCCVVLRLGG